MKELEQLIESYNEYLERLVVGTENIAKKLRGDLIEEGVKDILDFSEGLLWMIDAEALFKQNGILVENKMEKINEFLEEINSSLEREDYLLVADLFEYEIAPYFASLQGINQ